jgi:hypothetical protein
VICFQSAWKLDHRAFAYEAKGHDYDQWHAIASAEFLAKHGHICHPKQLADVPRLHFGNLTAGNSWLLK